MYLKKKKNINFKLYNLFYIVQLLFSFGQILNSFYSLRKIYEIILDGKWQNKQYCSYMKKHKFRKKLQKVNFLMF